MFFHRCIYPCTTFSFPYLFIFPLIWTRLCPYFQHAPWLRVVPSVTYICVSTPWLCHGTSLIDILANILWRNPQVCVLCCSMRLTWCYCQTGTFRKKYRISMCLQLPVHNFFPFFSIFIALWLFWNNMFCLMSYPWNLINRKISKCCMAGIFLHRLIRPQ